jgi:hypothetical protein
MKAFEFERVYERLTVKREPYELKAAFMALSFEPNIMARWVQARSLGRSDAVDPTSHLSALKHWPQSVAGSDITTQVDTDEKHVSGSSFRPLIMQLPSIGVRPVIALVRKDQ